MLWARSVCAMTMLSCIIIKFKSFSWSRVLAKAATVAMHAISAFTHSACCVSTKITCTAYAGAGVRSPSQHALCNGDASLDCRSFPTKLAELCSSSHLPEVEQVSSNHVKPIIPGITIIADSISLLMLAHGRACDFFYAHFKDCCGCCAMQSRATGIGSCSF